VADRVREDWGWLIEFIDGNGVEVAIGCVSDAAGGDGYQGVVVDRLSNEIVAAFDGAGIPVERVE
jgi:hypothetical protein